MVQWWEAPYYEQTGRPLWWKERGKAQRVRDDSTMRAEDEGGAGRPASRLVDEEVAREWTT